MGGPIALIEEGDLIEIDIPNHTINLCVDEDELARFLAADTRSCPYWRPGDDYITARKQ